MFAESASIYDTIHTGFDFAVAAERVRALVEQHKRSDGSALLDIACGTGSYLVHLRAHYAVEGLDLSSDMLKIARRKLLDVTLHHADMVDFDFGRRFDVVICLGSSIGYATTVPRLRDALRTFARHTRPGGVVLVEPWFTPDVWEDGRITADLVDHPTVKIARILVSGVTDGASTLDIHHLVASAHGVEHFTEHHALGLFTDDEYLAAFREAGLEPVSHESRGFLGRGLYIGVRTADPDGSRDN